MKNRILAMLGVTESEEALATSKGPRGPMGEGKAGGNEDPKSQSFRKFLLGSTRLAQTYQSSGRHEEAKAVLEKILSLSIPPGMEWEKNGKDMLGLLILRAHILAIANSVSLGKDEQAQRLARRAFAMAKDKQSWNLMRMIGKYMKSSREPKDKMPSEESLREAIAKYKQAAANPS